GPRVRRFFYLCVDLGGAAVATARPVRPGLMPDRSAVGVFAARHRYHPLEALPWAAAIAAYFAFPSYLPLGAQILATILFALSADLVLGYAGIFTLGQAAFFGARAYPPGLRAAHCWRGPRPAPLAWRAAPAL